jgi:hypothetical protein
MRRGICPIQSQLVAHLAQRGGKCFDLPLLPVHCGLLFLKFPMRPEEFIKQHRLYRLVVNSHYFALFTSNN